MFHLPGFLRPKPHYLKSKIDGCQSQNKAADILVIHARFSASISLCDRERIMELNVTLSRNLPQHDNHCLSVLYSIGYLTGRASSFIGSLRRL